MKRDEARTSISAKPSLETLSTLFARSITTIWVPAAFDTNSFAFNRQLYSSFGGGDPSLPPIRHRVWKLTRTGMKEEESLLKTQKEMYKRSLIGCEKVSSRAEQVWSHGA